MALKISMSKADAEKLCFEMFQNYPEAGQEYLRCTRFKYGFKDRRKMEGFVPKDFEFHFTDDDGKNHVVKIADAIRGLFLFLKLRGQGKLPGISFEPMGDGDMDYDAFTVDAIAQLAIFGEVIYG